MPQGSKEKYTDKQIRQADHIADSYEDKGVPKDEAEERAWRTVNKQSGGGKKSGSGRGRKTKPPAAIRKGTMVVWKEGDAEATGKVMEVHREKVAKTIAGKKVAAEADPSQPAYLIALENGGETLKPAAEVRRA